MKIEDRHFQYAAALAEQNQGLTDPNPPVAAIALDVSGQFLGEASHLGAGKPHAEALLTEKLRQENRLEKLHTMIVTLEPCSHQGRTPPCTQALLNTPVKSVLFACKDTNPHVKGQGQKILQEAGIHCELWPSGDSTKSVEKNLAPFFKHVRTGLPWITVKEVVDPDGSMIPKPGRKTFSSEKSLVLAHSLRKKSGAIVTGVGTVLRDLPEFTVRKIQDFSPELFSRKRILVVLDRNGRTPKGWILSRERAGFEVWIESDLPTAFEKLGKKGTLQVLVEAGPTLLQSIRNHHLWDEWVHIQTQAHSKEDLVTVQSTLES